MQTLKNNTPAFPVAAAFDRETIYEAGMSKRFYAACMIAQAIKEPCTFQGVEVTKESYSNWAKKCYALADELLKQENN